MFALLGKDRILDPICGDWASYGTLGKGRLIYVAVWNEVDGMIQLIEVTC